VSTPTTREDIVEATAAAFTRPPASVIDLLEAAIVAHATPATLAAIKQLPDRAYSHVRDLWIYLPDIAISA
jgi:hypothetical protein